MATFNDLDHELVSLIADNIHPMHIINLALVCKLGKIGVYNSAVYNHMHKFKHVVNAINTIEYIYIPPYSIRHGPLMREIQYRLVNNQTLRCSGFHSMAIIIGPYLDNKVLIHQYKN
jgi:hypothetical protein